MDAAVTITIGDVTRPLSEAGNDWINAQINGRNKDGPVCVRVRIKGPNVDLLLTTGACSKGGGGGGVRQTSQREDDLLTAWDGKGLNAIQFPHGSLVSFINSLR
jgi:hypothetical protein